MAINPANNYAFIDSQNLHLGIKGAGWSIDYSKFRIYLAEKYGVRKAYLFIGFMEENAELYKSLQEHGYILVFKPVLKYRDGHIKGNCDAELVLQAMVDYPDYDKCVLVSGDGDFHCLVEYLIRKNKFEKLFIPNQASYSALLKRFDSGYITFLSDLKHRLEHVKRKEP